MRNSGAVIMMVAVMLVMVVSGEAFARDFRKWRAVARANGPVKIYLSDIENKSEDPKVDINGLKSRIKDALEKRKSTKFVVVDKEQDADIVFKGTVTKYLWTDDAPITNIYPPVALAVDIATRGKMDWVEMDMAYTITSQGSGRELLDRETRATIKEEGLSEAESYKRINERMPIMLLRDMFKRPRR